MISRCLPLSLPDLAGTAVELLLSPQGQACYRLRLADREGKTLLQQEARGALLFAPRLLEALGLLLLVEGEELTEAVREDPS